MAFLLAFLPIAVILFLMTGLRWGAARAGAAGYLVVLGIAATYFGATPELLAYAHAKALLLALDVLLIIWAAFLLYRVADEAGAIRTIGLALPHLTGDPGMQALLIGWVFASFLQGIGGFGVPVAVIAPLLSGLGYSPLAAVMLPSIGHGWAVTFGSLGSSFNALMAASGLPGEILAPPAALFLGLAGVMSGGLVAQVACGWVKTRTLIVPVLILGGVMGVVQYGLASTGLWNIGAFGGGLAGLLVAYPLARRFSGQTGQVQPLDHRALLVAVAGYGALVVIILSVQLVSPLRAFLGQVVIRVEFPELVTRLGYRTPAGYGRTLTVFRHTGVVLGYAALAAYWIYAGAGRYIPGAPRRILVGTFVRIVGSSVSILSMVSMAVIMEHAGMTDQLARGLAEGVGRYFPPGGALDWRLRRLYYRQ